MDILPYINLKPNAFIQCYVNAILKTELTYISDTAKQRSMPFDKLIAKYGKIPMLHTITGHNY